MQKSQSKTDGASMGRGVVVVTALLVFAAAFAVFIPALSGEFLAWDDETLIVENLDLRQKFGLELFKWAYTAAFLKIWTPLTLVSFSLDYRLWGLNPWGFHFTNNILHALNALLVFVLCHRLVVLGYGAEATGHARGRALIAALVTALVFAVHPLHVESVAWLAERKDVLFAFFYLLGLLCYVRYASIESRRAVFYVLAIVFAFASASSKPMAVSFPLALIALDLFPLRRLQWVMDRRTWLQNAATRRGVLRVIIDKLPFVAVSLLTTVVMLAINRGGGVFRYAQTDPAHNTVFMTAASYVFYLYKFFLPLDLRPLYPHLIRESAFFLGGLGSLAVLAIVSAYAIISFRKRPYVAAIWFFYCATLLPTALMSHAADRYAYISIIAPALLLGLLAVTAVGRPARLKITACVISLGVLITLSTLTVRQERAWKDDITLWNHQLSLAKKKLSSYTRSIAHVNRGSAYSKKGFYKEALNDYNRAIENSPGDIKARYGRGGVHFLIGDYNAALKDFTKTIELAPKYADAYAQRGLVLLNLTGNLAGAEKDFIRALELDPRSAENHFNMGNALAASGKFAEAVKEFDKAIDIDPGYARAYFNRGDARAARGDYSGAVADFSSTLELDPDSAAGLLGRGDCYAILERYAEAAKDYEAALKRVPDDAETRSRLAKIHKKLGKGG